MAGKRERNDVVKLRCSECGLVYASLQNGCLVVQSKHYGEKHICVISLAELMRLYRESEATRVLLPGAESVVV